MAKVSSTPVDGTDGPPHMGLLDQEQGEAGSTEAKKDEGEDCGMYVLVVNDDTGHNARVVAGDSESLYRSISDFSEEHDKKPDDILTYRLGTQVNIRMIFEIEDVKK